MKKAKHLLVFLTIICTLCAIALYTGSRIFLSRLPFTTWCQTISVEDLDSAYINVRYPDGSYKPTELTAEERSRLVSVLNHLSWLI